MAESNQVFSCGDKDPKWLITFSVADEEKVYSVCKSCADLLYFKKYVLKKVSIDLEMRSSMQYG